MLEFLQHALATVLTLISLISAPLSVLGVKHTQQMAAVGAVGQGGTSAVVSLYNGMSPTVLSDGGQRQMWLSGKPNKASPEGMIYTSFYNQENSWFDPRPVFSLSGQRVSDPFVLRDPKTNQFRMYYSIISSTDAASTTLLRLKNRIGHAHSADGVEWVDDGIVIDQNNGLDERGGWAPSAIVVGSEIWLYYSTNYPGKIQVYRTRFTLEGRQIGTDPIYTVDANGQKTVEGFNVDVHLSRDLGKYVMFLNKDFTGIVRYVSDDGLVWSVGQGDKNPVVQAASSSLVAAPTIEVVRGDDGVERYNLFFVGGPISKAAFEGVYQMTGVPELGDRALFVDPRAKDYETWASAGSDQDSSGGSGGGSGALGMVALVGVDIAAIIGLSFLSTAATLPVVAVKELALKSFGGKIVGIKFGPGCINFTILPAGAFPIDYVWLPTTIQMSISPPKNIAQQVLGLATLTPVACVGFGAHPPIWYGLPVVMGGTSPL